MKRVAERHSHLVRSRAWRVMRMTLSVVAWVVMAVAAALILTRGGT